MIIRLSEQKLELKNGNEITRGHDSVFAKSESLKGYIKYLYGPKESGTESIAPAVRVRYSDNNAHHLSSPEYFFGTPLFEQKLDAYSTEATAVWIETQHQLSKLKKRRRDRKENDQNPILQELILSFHIDEMSDLKNDNQAIAERTIAVARAAIENYTKCKFNDLQSEIKVHIKENGIVDAHCLIGFYNRKGLSFDFMASRGVCVRKSQDTLLQLEQSGRFPFLKPIATATNERKQSVLPPEHVADYEQFILSTLAANRLSPQQARRVLIDNGIRTVPLRKGNQLKSVAFEAADASIGTDAHFRSARKQIFEHVELYEFEKASRMDLSKAVPLLERILATEQGKSLADLAATLDEIGWILDPNPGRKDAFAFVWKNTNSRLKASRISFDAKAYPTTADEMAQVIAQAQDFKVAFKTEHESRNPLNVYALPEAGGIGSASPARKRRRYERWEIAEAESLEAFIERMKQAGKRAALVQSIRQVGSVGINVHTGREAFRLLSSRELVIRQDNASSIKSGLQALSAMNRPALAPGQRLSIKLSGGTEQMQERAWHEAMLLGYAVSGYEPSRAAKSKLQAALDLRLSIDREKNRQKLAKLADYTKPDGPLVLSYYTNLDVQIDRRALALTYADAIIAGIATELVMNPPGLHPASTARATQADLTKHRDLILNAIAEAAPSKLTSAKVQLELDIRKDYLRKKPHL